MSEGGGRLATQAGRQGAIGWTERLQPLTHTRGRMMEARVALQNQTIACPSSSAACEQTTALLLLSSLPPASLSLSLSSRSPKCAAKLHSHHQFRLEQVALTALHRKQPVGGDCREESYRERDRDRNNDDDLEGNPRAPSLLQHTRRSSSDLSFLPPYTLLPCFRCCKITASRASRPFTSLSVSSVCLISL